MRHTLRAFALALGIVFALGAGAQQPIKIGFIAEFSGSQGAIGQDLYDSFMLVVERNGGKLGGFPVQILKEDSQLKPEVANQIVEKLIEKDRVPIITGVLFSNIMMTIYKRVVDSEVFLIGSNASPSPIAGAQCSPFYFQVGAQNDQRPEAMGQYAADKGYRRIYAMAPNYQAGKDFIAGFKRYYKQPLLEEVYTPLSQLDFQAELAQLSAAKPDAVFVIYPGGLGVQFVRQWRQAGLFGRIPLLSASTVDAINLPALKEQAMGIVHAGTWGPDFDYPASKRFLAEFDKKHDRVPSEYGAGAYDSAQLLDAAIAKVKGNLADKKAFMAALKTATFQSPRGNFKFNNNNLPIQDFYIFEATQDSKGRYVHKTVSKIRPNAADSYHTQCPMK